jgi:hypothetical protein
MILKHLTKLCTVKLLVLIILLKRVFVLSNCLFFVGEPVAEI